MSIASEIKSLRAGHYSENILVQITSREVVDEAPASCAVSQWPLMCANSGIWHIAQKRFVDGSTIYNGGISRITGLGELFRDLLRGVVRPGAGALNLGVDDSPMMKEALDIDWSNSVFKARSSINGASWADSIKLFSGVLSDGELKNQRTLLAFRTDSNRYFLTERLNWVSTTTTPGAWDRFFSRVPFGYCSKYAVMTDSFEPTSGDGDWYYYATAFPADDKSYKMWRGDTVITGLDGADGLVEAQGSAGWGASPPTDEVKIASKGYNTGGFKDKAGGILLAAKGLIGFKHNNSSTYNEGLAGLTFNSASLNAYDTACGHFTGFVFDNFSLTDYFGVNGTLVERSVLNDEKINTWIEAIETLVGGTGGLAAFNREGELVLGYMLNAPTATAVLQINKSDFASYKVKQVQNITRVVLGMPNEFPNGDGGDVKVGDDEFFNESAANLQTVSFETSIYSDAHATTLANRYIARFGKGDYRFENCLMAKVLSVGDAVEFESGIDDHLDTANLKGWVIGVERGNNPWVEVRA